MISHKVKLIIVEHEIGLNHVLGSIQIRAINANGTNAIENDEILFIGTVPS